MMFYIIGTTTNVNEGTVVMDTPIKTGKIATHKKRISKYQG